MQSVLEAIDAALAVDLSELSDAALMDRVLLADTLINRLQGLKLAALERIDRRGAALSDHRTTAAWLRAQTNCGPGAASRAVGLARDLADTMPHMASALAAGDVSVDHAQVAAGLRKTSGDELTRQTDEQVADAARHMPIDEFRAFVTNLRHALRPEAVADDERTAYDERELAADTTIDGIGVGRWLLDPVSHELVMTAIHAASAPRGDSVATPRQRRADGLVTIAQFFLDHHAAPATAKKALPHLLVRVDLPTLTGDGGAPAATTGYGATISGAAARRIGCDAILTRVVFGPGSEIIEVGRASRTFTPAARRSIIARDGGCIWPGCTAPPAWCEAHHVIHWSQGGPSEPENGALLCGRHHDRIHHHRHAIVIRADGRRTVDVRRNSATATLVIDERELAARGSPPARAG